jgi:hypothetical protein
MMASGAQIPRRRPETQVMFGLFKIGVGRPIIHGRGDEGGERFRQRAHLGAWESQAGRRDSGVMQTDGGDKWAWPVYKIIFNKYFFRSRRLLK